MEVQGLSCNGCGSTDVEFDPVTRKIHCNQKPQYDAKNRYGLADSYDLSFEPFKAIFDGEVERKEEKTVLDVNAPNIGR